MYEHYVNIILFGALSRHFWEHTEKRHTGTTVVHSEMKASMIRMHKNGSQTKFTYNLNRIYYIA